MNVAIRTEQLAKRYGAVEALAPLDLEVAEGEVFGYLGPNGAGKSTTIALLLGLARPSGGRAEIFGLDVRRDASRVHERVAYVPADTQVWPSLTGSEVLELLGNIGGHVDRGYRDELIERFNFEPDRKVRAYSHGNRQKIPLIAAFARRADLLVLDEPTSGLDPLMEEVFQDCVRDASRRGQTVFLSSHILSEVDAVCRRVAMLQKGRIIEVGELDVLRDLAAVRVTARFPGTPPDLRAVAGVVNLTVDGNLITCDVTGPIGPLLRMLSDTGVTELTTGEPSLEELFIARYGEPVAAGVAS
jgi:ABC-2 type transport system ATP-binding protein